MQCDILNLEWSSSGRDREVASLICYALRQKGYRVIEASIFNYKTYLIKYRPKLLYAADPKGARINYRAVKFAHKLGIPVVTMTAEGNYMPEDLEGMFWGFISDKRLIETLNLQWSSRARKMALELDLLLADQVKVSGAVGFDRYQIYQFYKKEDWLKKYSLDYPCIVGYASWAFDALYRSDMALYWEQLYGKTQLEQFHQDRLKVNEILKELIERNKDVLFILKEHPGVIDSNKTELAGLQDYANVLYVKNEEAVADLMSACDIWMAFESTTCLEAWLLGKPTLLINPSGSDFVRSNIYEGSPIFGTFEEMQSAIRDYFETGAIPAFDAKQDARQRIIQETIQWPDGKNHLRAAYLIEQVLMGSRQPNIHVTSLDKIEAFWQNILFEIGRFVPFLPKFRTYAAARKRFQQAELDNLTRRYEPYLETFRQENFLTKQDIEELERINGMTTRTSPALKVESFGENST